MARRGVVVILLVGMYLVSCVLGVGVASAETYHSLTLGCGVSHELSSTEGANVQATLLAEHAGGVVTAVVVVGGVTVVEDDEITVGGRQLTVGFYVPAAQAFTVGCYSGSEMGSVEYALVAAGSEGKTGATGATGPTGAEGKEGKEGKEGPEGKEGKGGSGGMEDVSFSEAAQSNLSEMKESMETIGWCIIGTILALALFFMVYVILKAEKR